MDVTNPSSTCYYVSQILDAGQSGPLFMVIGYYVEFLSSLCICEHVIAVPWFEFI